MDWSSALCLPDFESSMHVYNTMTTIINYAKSVTQAQKNSQKG